MVLLERFEFPHIPSILIENQRLTRLLQMPNVAGCCSSFKS